MRRLRLILRRYQPALEKTLADSITASKLEGFRRIFSRLPPPGEPPRTTTDFPFDENNIHLEYVERARNDLLRRRALTKDLYDRLAEDARREAFTVANIATEDTVEKIQYALAEKIDKGGTLQQFQQRMLESFDTSHLSPAHLETIYRTNINNQYARAQDEALRNPLVRDEFPFIAEEVILDTRTTPICLQAYRSGIDGTNIYLLDDPEYQRIRSPRHFNCRCNRIPLSVEDAARRGIRHAQEWIQTGTQPRPLPYVRTGIELPPGWTR